MCAVAQFKQLYAGSVFGYVWTLARPLAVFAVIYVVFSQVLGVGGGVVNYPAMLLLNLLLFQFFTDATSRSVQAMVASEGTLRKMEFPRAVIPSAIVLASVFTFALNLVAVLAILLVTGLQPMASWALVPLLFVAMLAITAALSFVLSTLFVQFRDIAQIWTVLSLTLFYASPIMYPAEQVPEGFRWILALNPLAPIFELMRRWAVDPAAPGPDAIVGSAWGWWGPALVALAAVALAVALFRRKARSLAEVL